MMNLYLCEKPSQAKDLAKVLGIHQRSNGFFSDTNNKVTWCIGHLLEQFSPDAYRPEWKKWSLDALPIFPDKWQLGVKKNVKDQFNIVKQCLREADHVFIATDGDREGETLGREVLDHCGYTGSIERVWLTALDDKSIKKALAKILPGEKTESLYHAGLGRARADWLVGMNLSRLFTLASSSDKPLTVGRVQTPTLRLVVDRDFEIEHFKPVDFFQLVAKFLTEKNESFEAKFQIPDDQKDANGHCLVRETVEKVLSEIEHQSGNVSDILTAHKKQKPPKLFSLSRLQQVASSRFGMGADATLKIAQSLYETHKATTYPRSDCEFLPDEQFAEVPEVLSAISQTDPEQNIFLKQINLENLKPPACFNTKKITAHHAIIPTSSPCDLSKMSADELKIYKLIRVHFIAQFFPDFEFDETTVTINVNGHLFQTKGRVTTQNGWHDVLSPVKNEDDETDKASDSAEKFLPKLTKGEAVSVESSKVNALKTTPPARFTEGTLIGAMKSISRYVKDPALKKKLKETTGIGTEATRASILKNLIDRQFIQTVGKKLISSETGRYLIAVLPESITDPGTTANWEQKLDEIVNHTFMLDDFITEQEDFIRQLIEQTRSQKIEKLVTEADKNSIPCPQCQSPMNRKKGKFGFFWGCSNYPDCKTILKDKNGKPVKTTPAKPTGKTCPKCQKDLVIRGKKGNQFLGCTGYPECKYLEDYDDPNETKHLCPNCNKKLIRRKGKKGFFWGCSGYPTCKTTAEDAKGKPKFK
jgi:DNA topoisomerase III